jgi:heptosyltransferase II
VFQKVKILVRGTNWIGDSVMSVPALRALRRAFPDSHIALHTRSSNEGLFRDADFIDRILPIDRAESSLTEVIDQARSLRGEKFDVAIIFPNSFASALTARFAGIPRRFGYSQEMRRLFLTDGITPPAWKNERHEVFYYLELVKAVEERFLGSKIESLKEPNTDLSVSPVRKEEARDFLARRGIDFSRPVIAIGAGSTNSEAKRWPAERFSKLIQMLRADLGANIILLGSEGDMVVSAAISNAAEMKPLDLTGKTSVADVTAILSVANLLISNDMGLAHVAPAVGTPTIVIFGPTNPITTRPFSPLAEVIRHAVECSPCMLRQCPIDHRCMIRISAESVFDLARRIIERNG